MNDNHSRGIHPTSEELFLVHTGEIYGAQGMAVSKHLDQCPDCFEKLVDFEQIESIYKSEPLEYPQESSLKVIKKFARKVKPKFEWTSFLRMPSLTRFAGATLILFIVAGMALYYRDTLYRPELTHLPLAEKDDQPWVNDPRVDDPSLTDRYTELKPLMPDETEVLARKPEGAPALGTEVPVNKESAPLDKRVETEKTLVAGGEKSSAEITTSATELQAEKIEGSADQELAKEETMAQKGKTQVLEVKQPVVQEPVAQEKAFQEPEPEVVMALKALTDQTPVTPPSTDSGGTPIENETSKSTLLTTKETTKTNAEITPPKETIKEKDGTGLQKKSEEKEVRPKKKIVQGSRTPATTTPAGKQVSGNDSFGPPPVMTRSQKTPSNPQQEFGKDPRVGDPDLDPDTLYTKGVMLEQHGEYSHAEEVYRKINENYPDYKNKQDVVKRRAACLDRLGRTKEAMEQRKLLDKSKPGGDRFQVGRPNENREEFRRKKKEGSGFNKAPKGERRESRQRPGRGNRPGRNMKPPRR